MRTQLVESYKPSLFLSSLGSGGLAVSFYLYLMFMIPHPTRPMATFEDIFPYVMRGDFISLLVVIDLAIILFFALAHLRLLWWNIQEFSLFKKSEAFTRLKNSPEEVSLMALPLTYAMTVNVLFILGGVFVPGLWSVVEYLFPGALIAFLAIGIYALKIFGDYFSRLLAFGGCDSKSNANFSKLIAVFAFSMISVGFAAPGAMSQSLLVNAIGLFFSIFFAALAITFGLVILVAGTKSMIKEGIHPETSVSLWVAIPILTVLGIAATRMIHGFAHGFEHTQAKPFIGFILASLIFSLQLMFGYLGYKVMKKVGYFERFIWGEEKSASSFAIICPGVAFFVFGMFFLSLALLSPGIITLFSLPYFLFLIPFVAVQLLTIIVFKRLYEKLLAT